MAYTGRVLLAETEEESMERESGLADGAGLEGGGSGSAVCSTAHDGGGVSHAGDIVTLNESRKIKVLGNSNTQPSTKLHHGLFDGVSGVTNSPILIPIN
mmetsp:Transcript_4598/g.9700  ORF Transcript_4598/g.9700 Transcript_4598/m.9700 type:complete len:99 (+) Transcript_4598:3244-3540(+)